MLQYTIKRLLLIVPTFFMVSLVIFVVLNIAPGRPGAVGQQDGGESEDSQTQRESYRIFKEQFALDRPILLNTRTALDRDDVRELLVEAYNLDGLQKAATRIKAQDELDDFGAYLVRHLIVLLDDADPTVQRLAARHLTGAARHAFASDRSGSRDPRLREQNRQIERLNQAIKGWRWDEGAPAQTIAQVKTHWRDWWAENHEAFEYSSAEAVAAFFLDTRFAKYWDNLLHVDFGLSTVDRRAVLPVILSKIKYSMSLTLVSVILAYLIAVPIGIFSAVRQGSIADSVTTVLLFILYSLPTFFTGTVLLRLLSEGDPIAWFPTGGYQSMDNVARTTLGTTKDVLWHLVLPVATYTSVSLAALSRYARAGVIEVIRADYVRTARAKGLHELVVIIKHAARNGMIPILTLLGSLLPVLVSGSVVIEVVFGIPGMGLYLYDSINLRDYNAVMAVLIFASLLTLLGILISDLSYAVADPRITFK